MGLISDQYKSESKKNDTNNKDTVDDILKKTNTPRVVIDPGHGGKSHPGAQGSTGLREADIAMYQAKRNGRDRVEVYSSNEV